MLADILVLMVFIGGLSAFFLLGGLIHYIFQAIGEMFQ